MMPVPRLPNNMESMWRPSWCVFGEQKDNILSHHHCYESLTNVEFPSGPLSSIRSRAEHRFNPT